MGLNEKLHVAKRAKNDEFYTQRPDVEAELQHYKDHFRDQAVYCNCDDPSIKSAFSTFFAEKFEDWGLKLVVATGYRSRDHARFSRNDSVCSYAVRYRGDKNGNRKPDLEEWECCPLAGDGDFRSEECIELLKQADIVVTNPPFSLFREYLTQLVEHGKKFLIIGNMNAITYKEVFPLIKEGKVWLGCVHPKRFIRPDGTEQAFGNICWFTNLPHGRRHEPLILYRTYNPDDYPTYDNYAAIEVSKVANIPEEYDGVMGVPISFLDKHCPEQFEIVGCSYDYGRPEGWPASTRMAGTINGRNIYKRILIRRLK